MPNNNRTIKIVGGGYTMLNAMSNFFEKKGYSVSLTRTYERELHIDLGDKDEATIMNDFRAYFEGKTLPTIEREVAAKLKSLDIPYETDFERRRTATLASKERIELVSRLVTKELEITLSDFLKHRGIKDPTAIKDKKDKERYDAIVALKTEMEGIIAQTNEALEASKNNRDAKPELIEEAFRQKLTHAMDTSLQNPALDKYSQVEKIGITILNIISVLSSPIKRLATGTWFYSTEGKPKETVQNLRELINPKEPPLLTGFQTFKKTENPPKETTDKNLEMEQTKSKNSGSSKPGKN